jgi:hypothetical protein
MKFMRLEVYSHLVNRVTYYCVTKLKQSFIGCFIYVQINVEKRLDLYFNLCYNIFMVLINIIIPIII